MTLPSAQRTQHTARPLLAASDSAVAVRGRTGHFLPTLDDTDSNQGSDGCPDEHNVGSAGVTVCKPAGLMAQNQIQSIQQTNIAL
jgi:hypothetical protein